MRAVVVREPHDDGTAVLGGGAAAYIRVAAHAQGGRAVVLPLTEPLYW
jgi:hypothetical protein